MESYWKVNFKVVIDRQRQREEEKSMYIDSDWMIRLRMPTV